MHKKHVRGSSRESWNIWKFLVRLDMKLTRLCNILCFEIRFEWKNLNSNDFIILIIAPWKLEKKYGQPKYIYIDLGFKFAFFMEDIRFS